MNKIILNVVLCMMLTASTYLISDTSASVLVNYSVGSIDRLTINGTSVTLNITGVIAGQAPTSAVNTSSTYAITTNNESRKLFASLATPFPPNLLLLIACQAPQGATSLGSVSLSTNPQPLVTGISQVAQSGLGIAYFFSTSGTIATSGNYSNTITFTVGP